MLEFSTAGALRVSKSLAEDGGLKLDLGYVLVRGTG